MNQTTLLALTLLAVVLGFRHGIDFDHIAAITDLVGGVTDKRRGFIFALWYAIGHEVVILFFGAIAVLVGWTLPHWVDGLMERFVGVTLLVLAIFLIVSLIQNRGEFVMVSRWRLLFIGYSSIFSWISSRLAKRNQKVSALRHPLNVSERGAFLIGIVHGIGAETPTQLLLFTSVAGLASPERGFYVVVLFVLGLFCSHMLITGISLAGYLSARKHRLLVRTIGTVTAVYSLLVGVIFTFGYAAELPTLL